MNKLPRRRFLAATGTMMAMSSVSALQQTLANSALTDSITQQRVLVLYRENVPLSRAFAMLGRETGLPVLALTADPVRQWRDGLGALLLDDDWRLAGLCNWIDYSIVRGLAAEERRLPLLMLQHSRMQLQEAGIDALAAAVLDYARETDAGEITRKHVLLTDNSLNINHRPGLFSWVI